MEQKLPKRGSLHFKGDPKHPKPKPITSISENTGKTQTELERLERYREQVRQADQHKLLAQFNERLKRQSEHNDIPNV
jgi:hypothetical protein